MCAGTGLGTYLMRNNMRVMNMNPWMLLGGTVLTMVATMMTDYERNWALKTMLLGGFVATQSAMLVPMCMAYGGPVVLDAALASGFIVGGLGLVAYNSPSE